MPHQQSANFISLVIRAYSDDNPSEQDLISLAIAIDSGFHTANASAIAWAVRAYRMSPSEFLALLQLASRRVERYRRRPLNGGSNNNNNKGGSMAHLRLTPDGVNP